jgi:TRAP-type C4-dicarboxylate transport system permease small subunit
MARALALVDRAVETLIFVAFLAIVLVGTAQVVNRYGFNTSLSWSEEFQRYGQIWVVFLGIPVAYRRGMHIGMDMFDGHLSPRGKRIFSLLVDVLWLVLATAIIVGLSRLMSLLRMQHSPGLGLPMHWVYGGMLLGAFYMVLVALRRIAGNLAGRPLDPGYGES